MTLTQVVSEELQNERGQTMLSKEDTLKGFKRMNEL